MLLTAGIIALGHMTRGKRVEKVGVSPRSSPDTCVRVLWPDFTWQCESPTASRRQRAAAGPWSPPSERASTGWRCRRRRGTSRCDTRRCGPSAPGLTGPYGEWRRPRMCGESGVERNTAAGFRPVWYKDRMSHVYASNVYASVFVLDPMQP